CSSTTTRRRAGRSIAGRDDRFLRNEAWRRRLCRVHASDAGPVPGPWHLAVAAPDRETCPDRHPDRAPRNAAGVAAAAVAMACADAGGGRVPPRSFYRDLS